MDDNMSIDKKENMREHSIDSIESTPEAETEHGGPSNNPDNAEQPKRKGGRKPIYATSEERKQRNRQAQAAFRERRTEYIKQLEETIRAHETNLHSLQTAHRSAADECLMLRYKNSLLERILLEKGIDVQAELRAKTGSPSLGPTHMPQGMVQPPTAQRAIMNRHNQARRTNPSIAPKLEPIVPGMGLSMPHGNPSPQLRPTPSSHHSSPSSNSPGFQTVMTPPALDNQLQQHQLQQQLQQQRQRAQAQHLKQMQQGIPPTGMSMQMGQGQMKAMGAGAPGIGGGQPGSAYFSSPFQNHIDQLEQEYDASADNVDEEAPDMSGSGTYPAPFQQQQLPNPQGGHSQQGLQQQQQTPVAQTATQGQGFGSMTQLLDPYDPILDMDPFGLSASMHFPTQFNFDTSSMR